MGFNSGLKGLIAAECKTEHCRGNCSSSKQILNASILRISFCSLGLVSSSTVIEASKLEFLIFHAVPICCTGWNFRHPKHAIYYVTCQSQWPRCLRPGTHYPHVTWAHVMLRLQLGCEKLFNIEFYDADSHFYHSSYVTKSGVELW
jgi:hypothetical protein